MTNIKIINTLNSLPIKLYFAITGGGQSFISNYLSVSGGSKVVMGATIPYSKEIFNDFIGKAPNKYCSLDAANSLAEAAYKKIVDNINDPEKSIEIGVGVTSSLITDNERVGREHKFFIVFKGKQWVAYQTRIINANIFPSRREQEEYVADFILKTLFTLVWDLYLSFKNEKFSDYLKIPYSYNFIHLNVLNYDNEKLLLNHCNSNSPLIIYPGSFSIPHSGHEGIIKFGESLLKNQVLLELTNNNADKGYVGLPTLWERKTHLNFALKKEVLIISQKTFKGKVEYYRSITNQEIVFLVGADTWIRIWDEKYGHELSELEKFFKENNVKFLVFGRNGIDIDLKWGNNLRINSLEAEKFNNPQSSSALIHEHK